MTITLTNSNSWFIGGLSHKLGTVLMTFICKVAYKCEGASHFFPQRGSHHHQCCVSLCVFSMHAQIFKSLLTPSSFIMTNLELREKNTNCQKSSYFALLILHCSRRYGILNPCYNSEERVVLFGVNALSLSLSLRVYWKLSLNNPRRRISQSSWHILVLRGWCLLRSVRILWGPKLIQLEKE